MKFDLSDLTVLRFGTTQINTQTNVSAKIPLILVISSPTVIRTCFLDIRCKILYQFLSEKNSYLGFQVFELASLTSKQVGQVLITTQQSVQNLPKYLSCLVYSQV